MKIINISLSMAAILLTGCGHKASMAMLHVDNDTPYEREGEIVEVDYVHLCRLLNTERIAVTDSDGRVVPSQITHDSLLIFPVNVAAYSAADYYATAEQSVVKYDTIATGAVYPDNRDDLCWENDRVGFRVYGPGTQIAGEKMYGYDLFLKRGTEKPVIASMIAKDKDPASWQEFDRLEAAGRHESADSLLRTFSYHVDHGYGMDCYAVGATLGACAPALVLADTLRYPGCYTSATILDNGPLRFSAEIRYEPFTVGDDTVVETRVITLDAGSNLNRSLVRYEGLSEPHKAAVGIAIHGDSKEASIDPQARYIAYNDPTQGDDNGELYVGAIFPIAADSAGISDNHVLAVKSIDAGGAIEYLWGFGWNRNNVASYTDWIDILESSFQKQQAPLRTTITKIDR